MKLNISWSEKINSADVIRPSTIQILHFCQKEVKFSRKSRVVVTVFMVVCVWPAITHQPHCLLTHTCSLQQNELSGMIWGELHLTKAEKYVVKCSGWTTWTFWWCQWKVSNIWLAHLVWALVHLVGNLLDMGIETSIMVLSSAVLKSNPIMLGLHVRFAIYLMKISVSVCGYETLNTSASQERTINYTVIMVQISLTISITADFWLHLQKHLLHVKKDVSYQIRLLANCHL